MRASVVKHARNAHYLKGTWKEVSTRVVGSPDPENLSVDNQSRSQMVGGVDGQTNEQEPVSGHSSPSETEPGLQELHLHHPNDPPSHPWEVDNGVSRTSGGGEERGNHGHDAQQDERSENTDSDMSTLQLFLSHYKEKEEENTKVYHLMVPRNEHSNQESFVAKMKELKNFEDYDVYEVVEKPKEDKVINTQWVIVDKEVPGEKKLIRKARLCMRGDQEADVQNIAKDAPTVNKINIKLMLTEAVRRGWEIESSDVTRAFLQTSMIDRDVYVRPPIEAGLPSNKVWKLKRPAYGLIDAAHSFFINYADNLISLGCETCNMDSATFYHFNEASDTRQLNGIIAAHIDDSLIVSNEEMRQQVIEKMKDRFTFGSHDKLPFRYVGLNIQREGSKVVIDQDHFVESIEPPDLTAISSNKKSWTLDEEFQTKFRSLVSKLNILSMSARPDIAYEVKVLTTKYGKASKLDLMQAIKLLQKVRRKTTRITIPDMGDVSDWTLVAYSDAATKKIEASFSVAGYAIFLVNKKTNAASPIIWSSKKIERVVNSSLAAETLAVVKLIGELYFIKEILKQMYGNQGERIPCLAITDSKDLHEAVHNVKNTKDKRLVGDILQIKQAIAVHNIIDELRHVPAHEMLADVLTKAGANGEDLLNCVRNGVLYIKGGIAVKRSRKVETSAWMKLAQAQSEKFEPDEEEI